LKYRHLHVAALLAAAVCLVCNPVRIGRAEPPDQAVLLAGFAEADITPKLGDKPVYLAGFGQNRKATGVLDPLKVRAVVLKHGGRKVALACADLVGFFLTNVTNVRQALPDFTYVLVSSTHNHEGPDTLGLWGPTPFKSGVDPAYLSQVESSIVQAIKAADVTAAPVTVRIGTARAPELLHDGREPYIKHDDLVVLQFQDPSNGKSCGLLVQWNCHPETLADKNTRISTDFVGPTVRYLQQRYGCPVAYFTGTVGGLMTSLHVDIRDDQGRGLADGTMEKTERYGWRLGQVVDKALQDGKRVRLAPLVARSRQIFVPLDNKLYLLGRQLGVLTRDAFLWEGSPHKATPYEKKTSDQRLCLRTEVGWLRLGELDVALIPGEIYPELVLDKVQDPQDPAADFPGAAVEPGLYKQLRGPYRMIVGLANDEIGYIIPKRQWDEKPPFCYGRKSAQYGEVNSVGPEAAPILCEVFKELVAAGP
jgi:hypothetical protein